MVISVVGARGVDDNFCGVIHSLLYYLYNPGSGVFFSFRVRAQIVICVL